MNPKPGRPLQFAWSWRLESSPDRFWPLLSDTDRFNREAGLPPLVPADPVAGDDAIDIPPGSRLLAMRVLGIRLRWIEVGFEWQAPRGFSVDRRFLDGPVARMKAWARLEALPGGGSRLLYGVDLVPRHPWLRPLAGLAARFAIPRRFGPVFRRFDRAAMSGVRPEPGNPRRSFLPGGQGRLMARTRELIEAGADPSLAERLRILLAEADDADLARIRPHALAREWGEDRRRVLEACLMASRAGLLDFRWDLLCPSCRGAKRSPAHLHEAAAPAHCEACGIDFKAALDHNVEVTFRPNASIRASASAAYCVGGPGRTPHVAARATLEAGVESVLETALEEGRYRLRCPLLPGFLQIRAEAGGEAAPEVSVSPEGWPREEASWGIRARAKLRNGLEGKAAFALERAAWADDAATAAEVTSLQAFRDLFADEALRPGEEIAVGRLAFLFTDLRGSTRLYREAGDAKAFGLVMEHFDLLKAAIAEEGGAVVKTIGDAVMAVFPHPLPALRAAVAAQARMESALKPLVLKAGVHCGACIAVNQNGRLDYFGSTLNLSARLLGFCEGGDLVATRETVADPETARWLAEQGGSLDSEELEVRVRGFDGECFTLRRFRPGASRRMPA